MEQSTQPVGMKAAVNIHGLDTGKSISTLYAWYMSSSFHYDRACVLIRDIRDGKGGSLDDVIHHLEASAPPFDSLVQTLGVAK